MRSEDPWFRSLRLLDRPDPRFVIGGPGYATRWEPVGAPNPRIRDGRAFSGTPAAVRFIVDRLRRIVRGTAEPRVRWREERFRQDPGRRALVLEIGGPHGHHPLYVKWVVDPRAGDDGFVCFISFHRSDRA